MKSVTLFASGIAYTLQDIFSTALAAGSVNGSVAEPSGQTRTVVDTNSKLSITGGLASFASGGAAEGNPGLWYPSQTRQAGLALLGTLVVTTNAGQIGWDANQSGAISFSIRPAPGTALVIIDNLSGVIVGASMASGISFQCAIVLRATGCYYFIKGDIFTYWTLIWVSALSSANLFPAAMAVSAIDVFTVDNMRVPTSLYIPLTLIYDTFTRADAALGSTESISPDSITIAVFTWNFTTGIWTISTNKAIATPVLGSDLIVNGAFAADTDWTKGAGWTIAAGVATATGAISTTLTATVAPLTNHRWYSVTFTITAQTAGSVTATLGAAALRARSTAPATYIMTGRATSTAFLFQANAFSGSIDNVIVKPLTTAELFASVLASTADVVADVAVTLNASLGTCAGLVVNLDSTSNPQNFIVCYLDGIGQIVLAECVAGVYTTKFTTSITYSAGAVLRVIRAGTSCRVFYNNAAVSTVQTMTANTNKNHGLFLTDSRDSLDAFTVWARGTGNEYSTLDTF